MIQNPNKASNKSRPKQEWDGLEAVHNQVQFCFQQSIRPMFLDSLLHDSKNFLSKSSEKTSYLWPEQNSEALCKHHGGVGGLEILL